MSRSKDSPAVDVEVSGFTAKGDGLAVCTTAPHLGDKVEVPGAIPGDVVTVKLLRKRKGVRRSLVDRRVSFSAEGVEPACQHFGDCGGCRLQRLPYPKQLEHKEQQVRHSFAELLTQQKPQLLPIIPCDTPWRYRNKMEFSFASRPNGDRYLV